MKTLKLTFAALLAATTAALVATAGTPNIVLSPRAASMQPSVGAGSDVDHDFVHEAKPVGSPRGLAATASLYRGPGTDSGVIRFTASSAVSPRAAATFPWINHDTGMRDSTVFAACKTARKGECSMNCCATATACTMPCCKS